MATLYTFLPVDRASTLGRISLVNHIRSSQFPGKCYGRRTESSYYVTQFQFRSRSMTVLTAFRSALSPNCEIFSMPAVP